MKRKVNFNRAKISSEEIKSYEDFDSVLDKFRKSNQPFYKNKWVVFAAAASILAISIIAVGPFGSEDKQIEIAELTPLDNFINPPMPRFKAKFVEYMIDVDEPAVISHTTGSTIKIPKRAFVDENGKEISGEVLIKYREFHDQIDILMSGIPMQYDSGGTQYQLKSAGMMELNGFQNGKPVFIKEGASLDVNMISDKAGDGYNMYFLDTINRNWENIENNLATSTLPIGDTSGITAPTQEALVGDDTRNFEAVVSDEVWNEVESLKEEVKIAESVKLAPPRVREDDKSVFEIDIRAEEFPELADYNGAKFQVIDEKSDFSEDFYSVEWSRLELIKDESTADEYFMIVSRGKRSHQLKVMPVFEEEDYKLAKAAFDKKFDNYKQALEKKQAALAQKIKDYEEMKKRKLEEFKAENKRRLREQEKRREEEKALRAGDVEINQGNVIRNLAVNRFGIYNCDTRMNWLTAYPTRFVTEGGESISGTFHHIDKNLNTVYQRGYYDNSNVMNFRYNPDSENIVLIFLKNEQIAVYHQSFYKEPKEDEVEVLKMKVYANLQSVKELKDILNI